MAFTFPEMALMLLELHQAPSYKSLKKATGLALGSSGQKHEHKACKLRATYIKSIIY
jgi:hypothetical protein